MKKTFLLCCILTTMLLALTACGKADNTVELDLDLDAAASALTYSGYFPDTLEALDPGFVAGALSLYEDRIEASPEDLVDARQTMALGVVADEFLILKAADDAAAERLEAALKTYAEDRKSAFEFYAPEQADRLDDAIIKRQGVYLFFVIGEDQESLSELCDRLLAGEVIKVDMPSENTSQTEKPEETPIEATTEAPAETPVETLGVPTEEEIQEAMKVAQAYYDGTVFEVVSMELQSKVAGEVIFTVCASKGGVVQEPNRSITLKMTDGEWKVVKEGY